MNAAPQVVFLINGLLVHQFAIVGSYKYAATHENITIEIVTKMISFENLSIVISVRRILKSS